MNFWHYVEIENVESVESISDAVESVLDAAISISIVSIIFEKLRKIKINNFKVVTIMKNRLKCNDKNFLKDEINAKNAWKILKNSFSSFESKMLNDLLIKLWIITFVNNQNVTNYARRFKMTMQNIRKMIINVSINNNLFILYFHLNLDAKFKQYREHYAQIHEIVSNESNSIININYAINRFLNICVNRSISKKLILVMIVIIFVSHSFLDKIQSNAFSKIKSVVIIIVKMCIICEKNITRRASIASNLISISSEIAINSTKNETIETTNANEETTTTTTKDSIRKSMMKKKKHKIYIVINLEILTIMSAMSRHVAY
jgi:hypothetical protein